MKILVISQVFYPDTASVAQHLSDLCFALARRDNEIKVISSRYPSEKNGIRYSSSEVFNAVSIKRIWSTRFGKKNIVSRLLDFSTFNISTLIHLSLLKRKSYDLIIGLTAPPLLSYFGAHLAKKKDIRFCYWIMDMQPELAIYSGLIKRDSLLAKVLVSMGNSVLKISDKIIILDRFMKDFILEKNIIEEDKMEIVPVWSVIDNLYDGTRLDNPFRKENGFGDKIVIMYSGNHSYVHPLDTLLDLAKELKMDERFLFVFIGSGIRKKDVSIYKERHNLKNILQLPFQPRDKIHYSLGSSDIQVVILGDNLVGFTHPNKIYGALFIGKPMIYIGPTPSHISEILSPLAGNIIVNHGDTLDLKVKLLEMCEDYSRIELIGKKNQKMANEKFVPEMLIEEMCMIIENVHNFD